MRRLLAALPGTSPLVFVIVAGAACASATSIASSPLPYTGVEIGAMIGAAAVLLAGGVLASVAGRHRRSVRV